MAAFKEIRLEDLTGEDNIIAFVGLTGSGVSSFVATATAQTVSARKGKVAAIGHNLDSHPSGIRAIRFPHPRTLRPFVLVDTPGFDNSDPTRSDSIVATTIEGWLSNKFQKTVKLAGIVYLHRISDKRLPRSVLENVQKLVALCGGNTVANIVLATTMWSSKGDPEVKNRRETTLEAELNKVITGPGKKITMMRFGDSFISAWDVIDRAANTDKDHMDEIRFQQELAELGDKLNDNAGREKFKRLQASLAAMRDILRRLREGESDERLLHKMNEQYEELRKVLQATFDHLVESPTKLTIGRRFVALFSFKKSVAL